MHDIAKVPQVESFMTRKLVTLTVDMEIGAVIKQFLEHDIPGAPVVDEAGGLLGLLSETDCLAWLLNVRYYHMDHGVVGDYMTEEVSTVTGDTDIFTATDILLKHAYRRLPVVDNHGHLIGIVSRRDVMAVGEKYCCDLHVIELPDNGLSEELQAKLGRDGRRHISKLEYQPR